MKLDYISQKNCSRACPLKCVQKQTLEVINFAKLGVSLLVSVPGESMLVYRDNFDTSLKFSGLPLLTERLK